MSNHGSLSASPTAYYIRGEKTVYADVRTLYQYMYGVDI
jgi:hypothetical protein